MLIKLKNSVLLLLVILISINITHAQHAYFYIEGDQETPFYVKVEGKMAERLGKNYAIISNLGAGYTNFEILFEQNKFPPQKFILEVPETGSRGFVINKISSQQFALYDIDQKRFIVAGNTEEDDYVLPGLVERTKDEKEFYQRARKEQSALELIQKYGQTNTNPTTKEGNKQSDPKFIDDIVLNNTDHEQVTTGSKQSSNSGLKQGNQSSSTSPSVVSSSNFRCPESMSNQDFENIALRFLSLNDDTQRLRFIRRNTTKQCFSTEHVRILASNMESQSGKFEVVKMLYDQTTDQEEYGVLESLFQSNFVKSEFRKLIK